MKRTLLAVGIAMVAMAASTTVTLAIEAFVTRDTPVYRNRTSDVAINGVERGQIVDVLECRGERCRVRVPGPDGWVRQDRLAPLDDEGDPEPGMTFRFNIPGGPGISIGIGEGNLSQGGPTSGPRACIYEHENYAGSRRCFAEGSRISNLTSLGWNDVVSSVRVYGGAIVKLCEHAGGDGICYTLDADLPRLRRFNDQASSVEVY